MGSYPQDRFGGSGGGGTGPGRPPKTSEQETIESYTRIAQSLISNGKFQFAARVAVGTALRLTGTDTLASVAIAAAKGYQVAQSQGVASGIKTAVFEFAKGQVTGAVAGSIASGAVQYVVQEVGVHLQPVGENIIEAALATSLEQLSSIRKSLK